MVDQQILLSRAKHITDTKKTSCPCAHSLSAHTTNNICSFWFYSTLIKRHENQKLASAAQHLVAWRNIYTHTHSIMQLNVLKASPHSTHINRK